MIEMAIIVGFHWFLFPALTWISFRPILTSYTSSAFIQFLVATATSHALMASALYWVLLAGPFTEPLRAVFLTIIIFVSSHFLFFFGLQSRKTSYIGSLYTAKQLVFFCWQLIFFILLLLFFALIMDQRPIIEHDFSEYLIQASYFRKTLQIDYPEIRWIPEIGFRYVGLHGFGYLLQITWELLVEHVTRPTYLLLTKIEIPFLGLVFLAVLYNAIRSYLDRMLAILFTSFFFFSIGFHLAWTQHHLDSFRLLWILLSSLAFYRTWTKPSQTNIVTWGFASGIASFSHSLSLIVCCICWVMLFIRHIKNSSVLISIKHNALAILCWLLIGNIHYLIDSLVGSGWLFRAIQFF